MRLATEVAAGLSSTSSSQGETIMNATRYLPFAGCLFIGLAFAMSGLSNDPRLSGARSPRVVLRRHRGVLPYQLRAAR
jgi:hypothetical protein